jgi:thiol-disulfide isomerase/thioredoxin
VADVDAPTTLPHPAAMPGLAARIGSVVVSPVRALRAHERDKGTHPVEPVLLYALVVLGLHAAESYRALAIAGDAPWIALKRLVDVIWRAGRTDLVVLAVAAAVVAVIGQWRGRRPLGVFVAVSYLGVQLALWKAIGGLLSLAGIDLWFMPHRAVDSMAVVVGGKVDMVRFAVKCAVAYGPGLAVLLAWLATLSRADDVMTGPRAVVARRGAAVAAVVVLALGVGAVAQVASRREALRPKLGGDAFPSLALPRLDRGDKGDRGGRIDVIRALQTGARVVVVDFWASWCGPCKRSLPELSQIAVDYRDRGVVVYGVNREPSDQAAARATWEAIGPAFDSVVDTAGLGERLGLTSLPTSYVVGADGRIRHVHLGYTEPAVLRAELDALLAAP